MPLLFNIFVWLGVGVKRLLLFICVVRITTLPHTNISITTLNLESTVRILHLRLYAIQMV